ncbi:patatin-like phospholipase family protein [Sulfidibacter corallicola]|uniref:Patatin-like phospholipase family protein n=1 Tax=Sulfidibacter corallicola TaxID=2818388 RepID=A0A8A4TYF9_SULCO|nr:patatin-like phospholipase family protein [Sulfidibacter corallicola]QTD54367.1 patatin-like phospholipase family protein [Sulfidibacter corallicola]
MTRPVLATSFERSERPRIGLALSGGGAKGCAHIGVLKVLEDMRIPVDYVAGTSMGAVVGGMFAAGLSAEEIEAAITGMDWVDVMEDVPRRVDLTYRRKQDKQRYLLDFQMGLKDGSLLLPRGLRLGQKLRMELMARTLHVAHLNDFDALPIPFRAVATDIGDGSMVVLERGSLVSAIRASMAIPGVLSPVLLDDCLLVDGGMTRNLPIDIVRDMGADVVIAVDISDPLMAVEELTSLFAVSSQAMGMLTRINVEQVLGEADHLVVPDVEGIGVLDFADVEDVVRRGAESCQPMVAELEHLSLPPAEFEAWRIKHHGNRPPPPVIAEVRIEGNRNVDTRFLQARIHAEVGEPLDVDLLYEDLGAIYGLGDFEEVGFRLEFDYGSREVSEDAGTTPAGLVVYVREKFWGPNYVHLGFRMGGDVEDDELFGVLFNLTMTRINRFGAELRNDLELGRQNRLYSQFYQPLGFRSPFFLAPSLEVSARDLGVFVDDDEVADLQVRGYTAEVAVGLQMNTYGLVQTGMQRGELEAELDVGTLNFEGADPELAGLDGLKLDVGAWVTRVEIDRLDQINVPLSGVQQELIYTDSRRSFGAEFDYRKIEYAGQYFKTWRKHTLFTSLDLGHDMGEELPAHDEFELGGFLSLSGYSEAQLRGQLMGLMRAGYYYRFKTLPTALGRGVYLGGWWEGGNVWETDDDIRWNNLRHALTFILGMDTVVGPVYVAYGLAEKDRHAIYVSLGTSF